MIIVPKECESCFFTTFSSVWASQILRLEIPKGTAAKRKKYKYVINRDIGSFTPIYFQRRIYAKSEDWVVQTH